ncbi:MAG: GNAT family N-acetyltransferase [Arcobacteraceae bacterium]|jgi:ribosomal-protein-alanine N-acetyltransferase|nr:GNAT family N-acetyltransferase [Arcobacteraceae bacterium]
MIRVATKEDLSSLESIENSIFSKFDYPLNKRNFSYHIEKKHIFVTVNKNEVYGYILFFEYKKSIRIYSIAVAIEYLGLGYGTELIRYLMKIAENKSKKLTLEVKVDNIKAINLYKKLGFVTIKLLISYYLDGKDGFKMVLMKK